MLVDLFAQFTHGHLAFLDGVHKGRGQMIHTLENI